MNKYQSSLGECFIIVSTNDTALLKTGKEFIVARYPVVEGDNISWASGTYFYSFDGAVARYQEIK